jgi:hypothetical protein
VKKEDKGNKGGEEIVAERKERGKKMQIQREGNKKGQEEV